MLKFQTRIKQTAGFTLVETMLAVLIISIVSAALYGIFSNGVQVWHRASTPKLNYEIHFFFEQLEADLRNLLPNDQTPFKGQNYSFEFSSLSPSVKIVNAAESRGVPARLKYDFHSSKHSVSRIVRDYYNILNKQTKPSSERNLLQGISRCTFQYFKKVNELQAPSWNNSWSDLCVPNAVKASVEYMEAGRLRVLTKVIPIPAGGCFV